MSAAAPRIRPSTFRAVLFSLAGTAVYLLISHLTGFGEWLKATPIAIGIARGFTVLFLAATAAAVVLIPGEDGRPRRRRDWFYAAVAILFAVPQAVLLVAGEDAI